MLVETCIEANELKEFDEITETAYHSINHLEIHRTDTLSIETSKAHFLFPFSVGPSKT